MFGKIKIDLYGRVVYWGYCSIQEFIDKYKLSKYLYEDYSLANGLSFMIDGYSYIFIDKDCDIFEVVPHESLHSAMDIMEFVSIKLDYSNQEPLAYLAGYISGKILNKINEDRRIIKERN